MAFGDLTAKFVTHTQSTDVGMNLLNKHFGKLSFATKSSDVQMTENKEEPALQNLSQDGGLEIKS